MLALVSISACSQVPNTSQSEQAPDVYTLESAMLRNERTWEQMSAPQQRTFCDAYRSGAFSAEEIGPMAYEVEKKDAQKAGLVMGFTEAEMTSATRSFYTRLCG